MTPQCCIGSLGTVSVPRREAVTSDPGYRFPGASAMAPQQSPGPMKM
jgi:hypothetical protein